MTNAVKDGPDRPRSLQVLAVLSLLALLLFVGLAALGSWQVERLWWKRHLIARVETRVHAEAVPPPGRAGWSTVNAADDEYRRLAATGAYLNTCETLVYAVTAQGAGYWVMTPLRMSDGSALIVNRGFVPANRRDPAARQAGRVTGESRVVGLLRISEPEGGFLRSNDPASGKWYSRDIAAIAAACGLADVAPYFLDADASHNAGGLPVGGLTVIRFPNNHLVYAITWYALALMVAAGGVFVGSREIRMRRQQRQSAGAAGAGR